jgi:hypothetical protein
MAGNDDLHPLLRSINKTLSKAREDIQQVYGEIQKVHQVITESTEKVLDAIHDHTKAQAELEMIDHVAEVETIKPKIEAKSNRIEEEQAELDEKLDGISDRYTGKHDELDEKATERIRDLGSHIFEIDEEEFESGIEDPFLNNVTSAWSAFVGHNDEVAGQRQTEVRETAESTNERISSFIEQQRELVSKIDSHKFDDQRSESRNETVQFPYYVVTVERNGVDEHHVYVPSEVSFQHGRGDQQSDLTINEYEGLSDLVEPAVGPTEPGSRRGADIAADIPSLLKTSSPLLDFESYFTAAVGEQVSVSYERGEH